MDAHGDAMTASAGHADNLEFDATFLAHYGRMANVIARVVRDRARAEELAVDVFVKWWRHPEARGDLAGGWLYRTAVHVALDELRRETRRTRYEWLLGPRRVPATPADVHEADVEQRRVRTVLGRLKRRDASMLLLRADEASYAEIAAALAINPSSVGTLVSRAQRAFREEYVRRYGKP